MKNSNIMIRKKMMSINTKILINLNTIDKVVKFSREIITLDSDVNIYQDSRYYDAKSILTIFSLNMNQKHYIEIISDNEDEIRKFNEIAEEYK